METGDETPKRLTMYSTTWCGDCRMAKAVLDGAGVEYEQIDIDRDPAAVDIVLAINGGYRTVPTIVLPDGRVLVEPSRRELRSALGLPQPPTLFERVAGTVNRHS
ncbi:MAG: glutaredoxin family protein [Candidatus Acidiferrales bacterium]